MRFIFVYTAPWRIISHRVKQCWVHRENLRDIFFFCGKFFITDIGIFIIDFSLLHKTNYLIETPLRALLIFFFFVCKKCWQRFLFLYCCLSKITLVVVLYGILYLMMGVVGILNGIGICSLMQLVISCWVNKLGSSTDTGYLEPVTALLVTSRSYDFLRLDKI